MVCFGCYWSCDEYCYDNWNLSFPAPVKNIIIIELLVWYSASFCHLLIKDETVVGFTVSNFVYTPYFYEITDVGAFIAGIPLGYLADSWTGKYIIVLIGIIFATIAPMCSLLLNLKLSFISRFKQILLYVTRYGIACCLATSGVRAAVFMDQFDPRYLNSNHIKNYVFLYWLVKTLAHTSSAFSFFCYTFIPTIILWLCVVVCLTIPFVILMTYIVLESIKPEQLMRGCLNRCFMCIWKSLSCSCKQKSYKNWSHLAGKVDVGTFYLSKRLIHISVMIMPLISVGIITFVIKEYIIQRNQMSDLIKWKYRVFYFTSCILFALELIILILLQFFIIPYLTKVMGHYKLQLKLLCISMFILVLAGVSACAVSDYINKGYPSSYTNAQIRIYNGLHQEVTLESEWFEKQLLPAGVALIVDDVPCFEVCSSTIKASTKEKYMELPIKALEQQSLTYLILNKMLLRLNLPDPINRLPNNRSPKNRTFVLIFSNLNNCHGHIQILNSTHQITLDIKNNSVMVEVPVGRGPIAFTSSLEEPIVSPIYVYNASISYSLFIYQTANGSLSLLLESITFQIGETITPLTIYLLLGPSIILCFGKVLFQMAFLNLLYLECPYVIGAFIYSLVFFALGIGPIIWIAKGTRYEIGMGLLIGTTFIQLIYFILFVYLVSHFVINFFDLYTAEEFAYYTILKKQPHLTITDQDEMETSE